MTTIHDDAEVWRGWREGVGPTLFPDRQPPPAGWKKRRSGLWLSWRISTERIDQTVLTCESCSLSNYKATPTRRFFNFVFFIMASGSGDEAGDRGGASWKLIGPASELSERRCRLLYSPLGHGADVCLFHVNGEFFAMDARCAHSGKCSADGFKP